MIKYEIYTDHFEFRMGNIKQLIPDMGANAIFDTYESCDDRITSNFLCPRLEASFPPGEDVAVWDEWNKNYANYGRTRLVRNNSQYLLVGELAWLEQVAYDEDGEFEQSYGILACSIEPYRKEEEE